MMPATMRDEFAPLNEVLRNRGDRVSWTRLQRDDRITSGVSHDMRGTGPVKYRRTAWRLMWIVVALAHVKATAIAWGPMSHRGWSQADLTHLFLLSASNLFFLLEI